VWGWQLTYLHIMSDLPVYISSVMAWSLIVVCVAVCSSECLYAFVESRVVGYKYGGIVF
jgi:hypothetical protein